MFALGYFLLLLHARWRLLLLLAPAGTHKDATPTRRTRRQTQALFSSPCQGGGAGRDLLVSSSATPQQQHLHHHALLRAAAEYPLLPRLRPATAATAHPRAQCLCHCAGVVIVFAAVGLSPRLLLLCSAAASSSLRHHHHTHSLSLLTTPPPTHTIHRPLSYRSKDTHDPAASSLSSSLWSSRRAGHPHCAAAAAATHTHLLLPPPPSSQLINHVVGIRAAEEVRLQG